MILIKKLNPPYTVFSGVRVGQTEDTSGYKEPEWDGILVEFHISTDSIKMDEREAWPMAHLEILNLVLHNHKANAFHLTSFWIKPINVTR